MYRVYVDFGDFLFPVRVRGSELLSRDVARTWARAMAKHYRKRVVVTKVA